MPFTQAPPMAKPAPTGTGITCSLRVSKRQRYFTLILNEGAQKRHFGRSIVGEQVDVQIGRGTDEGKLQLTVGQGDFQATASMRGSAAIKVGAWDLLPKDKRPGQSVEVIHVNGETLVLKLPSWAKPSGHDGKMAAEYGRGISAKKAG